MWKESVNIGVFADILQSAEMLVCVFGLSHTNTEYLFSSSAADFCVFGSEMNNMPKCDLWLCIFAFMQHNPSFLSLSLLQSTYGRSGSCGWGRAPVILSATLRRLVSWTPPTAL